MRSMNVRTQVGIGEGVKLAIGAEIGFAIVRLITSVFKGIKIIAVLYCMHLVGQDLNGAEQARYNKENSSNAVVHSINK